ncbi:electron transfer flavoprotein subunit beta/FixA family protein [Companilactobacillus mishanensis]|uniref:Electron transfer flavoprotein small subunit n=1 Tax=Companilactobacillus mishanensis TaxID=2486008 RepID=A0ABW9P7H5_9LACO|nr:electron transfer flavoprotein subunit beta/FixA family protein [Companilactobacillus mishanensis]MQS45164.1 electron transfer flavoprotein subunit beta/FixA family protein [Companilactobacillus mishanensis]
MKIVVGLKQVPETTNVKINEKTKNIDRRGVSGVINKYDRNALQTALDIRDVVGGTVIAMSMGPNDFAVSLQEALSLGADEAVLLSDRAFGGADTLATGYVLAEAIKKIGGVDLVIMGQQSVDADTGQMGPIVAEMLGISQVTYADEIQPKSDNELRIKRYDDNIEQEIIAKTPLMLTTTGNAGKPEYVNVVEIKNSFEKPLTTWTSKDMPVDSNRLGQSGSPTVVRRIMSPEPKERAGKMLSTDATKAAEELAGILHEENLLAEED